MIDLAIPRTGTSVVVDCQKCKRTVWEASTDRRGWCRGCQGLELVTLVPADKEPK